MNHVAFVGTEGRTPPEPVAIMNREFPAYLEEMDRRGVRLFGRELAFPERAATVCVRNGEMPVSDGPFVETNEFVGGLDLLDCSDQDEAIEVEGKSPVARFLPFEILPVREGLRLGLRTSAFAQADDSTGTPYLLTVWEGGTPAAPLDDLAVMQGYETWGGNWRQTGTSSWGPYCKAGRWPRPCAFVTERCNAATAVSPH